MILRNLYRRKIRTLLTIVGVAIGVAAIVGLGALAGGLETGYTSMLSGSKADLVLSQPDAYDISYSAVDEAIGDKLAAMPEVSSLSGMLQGFAQAEGQPVFFVFGYPLDSFVLARFQVIEGVKLDARQAVQVHGRAVMLGSAAAEVLDKTVGDSLRMGDSVFRIVGIYQTGDAFEDSGALLGLQDAQVLLGRPRQVSLYYIQLKDPALRERFLQRVERQYPDFSISGVDEFASKQVMANAMDAYVWVIGGLAILIGGVGMMNAQLMAVNERTREIGVLRALGWGSLRVMWMILGESVLVCTAGGLLGVAAGWAGVKALTMRSVLMGADTGNITPALIGQAFVVVVILGLVAGLYPAWRASRLQPVEALRYEGGGSGRVHRLPLGGMAVQGLWQRAARTLLTLGAIGLTVGAIMSLDGLLLGFMEDFSAVYSDDIEIMIRQADVADTSLSAIDERVGDKIAVFPEVETISGIIISVAVVPESNGFFVIQGYAPNEFAIRRYRVVEGEALRSNHQILLGRQMAEALNKGPGDTVDLQGTRFRVVGIYETGVGWEETGGVISLRDGQAFIGRARKVTMYAVKLKDPAQAEAVVEKINTTFPDLHAALSGEFLDQMPDMKNSGVMINSISLLAILVGGVGVLNTMLMSVFERTREIGVLRALGWTRRQVLGLILEEALLLGLLGGLAGMGIAFGVGALLETVPIYGAMIAARWSLEVLVRAASTALLLGVIGGLYPAWRATRLQPVEALRYE